MEHRFRTTNVGQRVHVLDNRSRGRDSETQIQEYKHEDLGLRIQGCTYRNTDIEIQIDTREQIQM